MLICYFSTEGKSQPYSITLNFFFSLQRLTGQKPESLETLKNLDLEEIAHEEHVSIEEDLDKDSEVPNNCRETEKCECGPLC